ncbi:hypothetical protein SAMN05880582_108149 [Rhizobium sp. RU20A]|uniref:hypothetical protein n=1 Tax=Rhizobium sp. RU20A TaxID=1907412 RepID=UPI000953E370|nr:hypothetical protein [Rhizobium sp. RU20A]SIR24801.1 hypothetical protein SAMN05880582_108149 [Rhizobium sp. RU20A]
MLRSFQATTLKKRHARFTVGQDHHGWWVVRDEAGLVGGLFCNEEAAIHFAHEECARLACALRIAPYSEHVELKDLTDGTATG